MADPHPVLGIDLNVPGSENDPEEDAQGLGQPVVQVYISNPIDWDQVARGFFFYLGNPIFFHQPEEGCCISSGYVFVFSLFLVAKLYVKFVGDDQNQGAGEDAQAQGAGEDASAHGAGEDEQAPDAGGDEHHSGQGSVLPDLNAMSFPDVLPYCTDLEDGSDDKFEDFGTNIGLGSSSGSGRRRRRAGRPPRRIERERGIGGHVCFFLCCDRLSPQHTLKHHPGVERIHQRE